MGQSTVLDGIFWRWFRNAHTSDAWVIAMVFKPYPCSLLLPLPSVPEKGKSDPTTLLRTYRGFHPTQRKKLKSQTNLWLSTWPGVFFSSTLSPLFSLLWLHWLTCLHACRHAPAPGPLHWFCSAGSSSSGTHVTHSFISFRSVVKQQACHRKLSWIFDLKLHPFFHPQIIPSSSLFDFTFQHLLGSNILHALLKFLSTVCLLSIAEM